MSRASVIRGYLTDAAIAVDTAEGEFNFAVEEGDEAAMSQALDYLEAATSAILDAEALIDAFILEKQESVIMRDLEGHGNLADR